MPTRSSGRRVKIETVVKKLETPNQGAERAKIPTTLVPFAPDKILVGRNIDILVGLFHIMWKDMPHPATYRIRLAELISKKGDYLGCRLECGLPRARFILR